MNGESVIEGDLPTEKRPETDKTTIAKLLFAMSGLYERWRNEMENKQESVMDRESSNGRVELTDPRGITNTQRANVNNVRIDLGGTTLLVVVLLVTIIGACGVVIGLDISERATQEREWHRDTGLLAEKMDDLRRQSRMTELKLDDWTVVAHRAGLQLPGDYTRGPQGNLDGESFKQSKRK